MRSASSAHCAPAQSPSLPRCNRPPTVNGADRPTPGVQMGPPGPCCQAPAGPRLGLLLRHLGGTANQRGRHGIDAENTLSAHLRSRGATRSGRASGRVSRLPWTRSVPGSHTGGFHEHASCFFAPARRTIRGDRAGGGGGAGLGLSPLPPPRPPRRRPCSCRREVSTAALARRRIRAPPSAMPSPRPPPAPPSRSPARSTTT